MTVNPLPPQAYTKETLQKAYTWLLNQTANVKELATTQDMMVSLYLRALRNGDVALETPSIVNFKQELKSLASLMGDLQTPQPPPQASVHTPVHAIPAPSPPPQPAASARGPQAPSVTSNLGLDQHSLLAIQEIKLMLNLSSDAEALRALISLGHKQFKKI